MKLLIPVIIGKVNTDISIGGVQNVIKKNVDKDGGKEKKDKATKTGGFRGLRGIV
jgi:hypothetical protein